VTDESIAALRRDAAAMAKARESFATRCMPCHGAQGQGVIGPNLTDEYWLHGSRPVDIATIITVGVPEKGMIPWKDHLAPEEIRALAAFIGTLQGTNPPNPKAPEGQKIAGGAAASR
jgi:cytochrome c oxidase cbb3-type subunit 3